MQNPQGFSSIALAGWRGEVEAPKKIYIFLRAGQESPQHASAGEPAGGDDPPTENIHIYISR
jgi:hypothetical protein